MADQNNLPIDANETIVPESEVQEAQPELQPEIQPEPVIDPLAEMVPEQEEVIGPGSPELQAETESALDQQKKAQDRFKKKKFELTGSNLFGKIPTDTEVLDALDAEDKMIKDEQAKQVLKEIEDQEKLEAEIRARKESRQRAEARGIALPRNELDDIIDEREAQEAFVAEAEAQGLEPATPEQKQAVQEREIAAEATPSVEEVKAEAAKIREQDKAEQAQILAQKQKQQEEKEDEDKAIRQVEKELNDLDAKYRGKPAMTAFEEYFKDKTLGQKILGGIMIALSQGGAALAKSKGPTLADQIIAAVKENNDREYEARKFSLQEKLKKLQQDQANAFKIVDQQLERMSITTRDTNAKENIKLRRQEIQNQADKLKMEMIKSIQEDNKLKRLASSEGLSKEEIVTMDPKIQDRFIFLGDGSKGLYVPTGAETAKKLRNEIIPNTNSSLKGLDRLLEINEQMLGGALDITGARAEAKALQQSLIGNLRLELFGPGVLTDTEQKIARDIIKNPATIFSLKGANKTALKMMRKKLILSTKDRLKVAGVEVPLSEKEKDLEQKIKEFDKLKSKGEFKGISKAQFINEYIKRNGEVFEGF